MSPQAQARLLNLVYSSNRRYLVPTTATAEQRAGVDETLTVTADSASLYTISFTPGVSSTNISLNIFLQVSSGATSITAMTGGMAYSIPSNPIISPPATAAYQLFSRSRLNTLVSQGADSTGNITYRATFIRGVNSLSASNLTVSHTPWHRGEPEHQLCSWHNCWRCG